MIFTQNLNLTWERKLVWTRRWHLVSRWIIPRNKDFGENLRKKKNGEKCRTSPPWFLKGNLESGRLCENCGWEGRARYQNLTRAIFRSAWSDSDTKFEPKSRTRSSYDLANDTAEFLVEFLYRIEYFQRNFENIESDEKWKN